MNISHQQSLLPASRIIQAEDPKHREFHRLNDDYDDDIQLFAMQSAKMQAEASRRSSQGPLGIEKI
jgi:hypothetical protein